MALAYRLHLDSPSVVADIMTMIASSFQASIVTEHNHVNELLYITNGPGLLVTMRELSMDDFEDPDSLINIVAETYAFQPTVTITMRVDKFQYVGLTTLGNLTLVTVVNDVLHKAPGDAVLNSELGLLLRRAGGFLAATHAGTSHFAIYLGHGAFVMTELAGGLMHTYDKRSQAIRYCSQDFKNKNAYGCASYFADLLLAEHHAIISPEWREQLTTTAIQSYISTTLSTIQQSWEEDLQQASNIVWKEG